MMHNLVLITLNWLFKTLGRYSLLAMGEVPGTRSMENSMSRSGGISGSSSGKTSGYSFTIGTASKDFPSILKTIGSGPLLFLKSGARTEKNLKGFELNDEKILK